MNNSLADGSLEVQEPPRSIAPNPRLSGKGFLLLLLLTCFVPLIGLTAYAVLFGRAIDKVLPVELAVAREPVDAAGGQGAILTEVIAIENVGPDELPNLTVDINGQYFLYRQSPLRVGERLVLPQQIFSTKSNQRWEPGRYPISEVNVTAKVPGGHRAIKTVKFGTPKAGD